MENISREGWTDESGNAVTLPKFSENMGDAWMLIDKVAPDRVDLRCHRNESGAAFWECQITSGSIVYGRLGSTAPHSICLAVLFMTEKLKAVG